MTEELHIGPYRERDPHLFRACCGIVANGMEYAESSKIPYMTIADYLWNPEQYEPEESWDYALYRVVGEKDWETFRIFADNNRFSCLYPADSPDLRKTLKRVEFLIGQHQTEEALGVLQEEITQLNRAVELFKRGMQNTILQAEIQKWIKKFTSGVGLLQEVAAYIAAPDGRKRQVLEAQYREYQQDRTYVFADVLSWFIKGVFKLT
jgi:hyaluronoglucosaminidase